MNETQGFEIVWQLATQFFVPSFVVLLLLIAFNYLKTGQPVSAATFLGFGLVLAGGEGASIYFTQKTISENHWFMDASDPNMGLIQNMLLAVIMLIIVVHLAKITIQRWRK